MHASTLKASEPTLADGGSPLDGKGSANLTATKSTALVLCAVTLLGLVLRLVAINEHSFWYDEAVSAGLTESSYADLYFGIAKDNGNPPLYPLLARAWSSVFGRSESGLRSLSAVAGMAAVACLALLGIELLGRGPGLIAGGLLAISPLAIELSNEARTYALLHLLVTASTLFFVRWLKRRHRIDLALYCVLTFLSCFSHYYAFFVPLTHLAALLQARQTRRTLAVWAGAMVAAAVLWSPWLPGFANQLGTSGNLSRMADRWTIQFAATPVAFGFGRTLAWRDSSTAGLLAATLIALIAFGIPLLVGLFELRRQRLEGTLLAVWFLLPILVPLVVAGLGMPVYTHRYATVGLPAFLLLVGLGLERCRPALLRASLVGLILAATAVSVVCYATVPLKDDWRAATRYVLGHLDARDVVVFDTDIEQIPFLYYARRQGTVPQQMFALTSGVSQGGELPGFSIRQGARVGRDIADCAPSILDAGNVWIALCVPNSPMQEYVARFRRAGYSQMAKAEFHRIQVAKFSRAASRSLQPDADGEN